jgi:arylsulfatase A-like enzyme
MDLHEPYLPGFRDLLDVGPISSYRTLYQRSRYGDSIDDRTRVTLRELYDACVSYLDRQAANLLNWLPDDALVTLTGDHGEEFDHGILKHARLYDEVVQVPMISNGDGAPPRRHVDIAPTVLSEVDVGTPNRWMGVPKSDTDELVLLMNHSPSLGKTYVGSRSTQYKYIRAHDVESGDVQEEWYDIRTDPDETNPITEPDSSTAIKERLEEYLSRDDVSLETLGGRGTGVELSPAVESRLEDLGYFS